MRRNGGLEPLIAEYHNLIDSLFGDTSFNREEHLRERYNLGTTPSWMKLIGITGENFSLSFKNIKTHQGKDAGHDLTKEEWHQLPDALQHPFLVTQYKGEKDRFRLYVNIKHNGNYVAVGVDVKRVNQGKGKPMLEVNSIKTVFGHHGALSPDEKILAVDEKRTPEQEAFLHGLNSREYPTIQELEGKGSEKPENDQTKGEKVAEKKNRSQAAKAQGQNSKTDVYSSEKEAIKDAAAFPYKSESGMPYKASAIRTDADGKHYVMWFEGEKDVDGNSYGRRVEVSKQPEGATMVVFSPNGVIPMGYASRNEATGKYTVWDNNGKFLIKDGEHQRITGGNVDRQGNPLNNDGTLKVVKIKSVNELTDDDFENPSRTVELPEFNADVMKNMSATGKTIIIKKNVFEKNLKSHTDVSPEDSRKIIGKVYGKTNYQIQDKPDNKPNYWILVNVDDRNALVLVDADPNKKYVEVVDWYWINDNNLGQKIKRAKSRGGHIPITPESSAGLSDVTSGSTGKGNNSSANGKSRGSEKPAEGKGKGEKVAENEPKHQRSSRKGQSVTAEQVAMRDGMNEWLRGMGIEVSADDKEGRLVLDMAYENEVRVSVSKKRALDTVSYSQDGNDHPTVVSSADGVKVVKDLDALAKNYEFNRSRRGNAFLGEVAKALGIPEDKFKDKNSQYVTFETANGKVVTIRISNHNATASKLDNNGQEDAISIVVTNKPNKGITNDGDAHIVEYYYNAIKLRKAEGKPLSDIVRSIQQSLYSGEYKDTTGLAERQEVNVPIGQLREMRVYHGSGADFERFDSSHMSECEGAQAHGWGHYVVADEDTGRAYATPKGDNGDALLYTVEVPDNIGGNYIDEQKTYDSKGAEVKKINDALYDELTKAGGDYEGVGAELRKELDKAFGGGISGKELYGNVSAYLGSDEAASKFLHSIGYKGIHYRGGTDGECYVIFDEKDLKITDKVRFFRTPQGEVLGFTVGGKIYLDPRKATPETTVHEYSHLWLEALKLGNREEYDRLMQMVKDDAKLTPIWKEVRKDYPEYSEEELTEEVFVMYSGREGSRRIDEEIRRTAAKEGMSLLDKATTISALSRLKETLRKVWKGILDFLHIRYKNVDEAVEQQVKDFVMQNNPMEALKNAVGEREIKNVKIKNNGVSRKEVLKDIPKGGKKCLNDDQGIEIYVSKSVAKHALLKPKDYKIAAIANIDKIIKSAVKIGELPVAEDERRNTSSVSIYYCPVNIGGKQYSARLVVKQGLDGAGQLTDFSLYQMGLHNEKATPTEHRVGQQWRGDVFDIASGYKVKDLIHNGQESDKKLIGMPANQTTKFQFAGESGAKRLDDAEERTERMDNLRTARRM